MLLVALACTLVGLRLDAAAADASAGLGQRSLTTPLLSARRVPSWTAEPVARRRLEADLSAWVAASPPASCLVVEGADGRRLFEHRPHLALVPASTQKLVTAAAALEALGGDARFVTRAVTTAAPGEVLAGDLVLVGGGDPLLASPDYVAASQDQPWTDLDALAARIESSGMRRIDGAIVGDEGRFDAQRYVAGWPPRYIAQDQIGPLSALSVNDGFEQYPTREGWRERVAAADPARNAAAVLTRLLEARGIDVVGEPRSGAAPAGAREVASIESAPLAEIVDQLLRESDNMTAEMLLKAIGLDEAGSGSTAAGREAVRRLLDERLADSAVVADGSGLGLANRATCDQLVDLLVDAELGVHLVEGLAVAGESGTLERRYADTALEGLMRAKTGTLDAVTALAGVVDDDDGRLVFAYLANGAAGERIPPELVSSQEQLGKILLSYPRTAEVAKLGPLPVDGA